MATVWVGLLATAMLGLMGLALDTGFVMFTAGQLANAADASALAGAQRLSEGLSGVQAAATAVAAQNTAGGATVALAGSDVEIGTYTAATRTFTPGGASPNAVRVTARRTSATSPVPLFFGALFSVTAVDVTRSATAVTTSTAGAGVHVLDPSASSALSLDSNAVLRVNDATIHVNSSAACAARTKSNAKIFGNGLNVVGTACLASPSIPVQNGVSPLPDPLLGLPAPMFGPSLGGVKLSSSQVRTISPGYYHDGIEADSNSRLTLTPGIYIVGGSGLRANSNATITGNGVMVYITGTGSLSVNSNADLVLEPPDSGTYAGITIFQDRANTRDATLNSNSGLPTSGTLYFPAARIVFESNAEQEGLRLVAKRIQMNSNARVTIEGALSQSGGSAYLVP